METSSFDGPKNVFTNSNYILPLIIDKPYDGSRDRSVRATRYGKRSKVK